MEYAFTIGGIKYSPEEMYTTFRPDIMSVSFECSSRDELLEERLKPLVEQGLVICNAAANEGSRGVFTKYKNIDITIE